MEKHVSRDMSGGSWDGDVTLLSPSSSLGVKLVLNYVIVLVCIDIAHEGR